ncbi:hypothetical protein [Enterovibrio norvegicus]|uniref:Uncharacterized protein n=2 Tax=Enterovibrio norvegicus TaxID=188144 RepID=A0A1I5QSA3_9GAMM|nr:hypothetical protein [Enterovibrio norvegicus]MCC4799925.1 hypothetical protein [Enterovibrio norvegicus]SFP48726.1 hypothetical protein SAMN03084138_02334 [Enterovibrio norvegicus DSM 15893]
MLAKKRQAQASFSRSSSMAANRRKRMRSNNLKKVLWRQRTFAIREFADFEESY